MKTRPTPGMIVAAAAEAYQIPEEFLRGPSRRKDFCNARFAAIHQMMSVGYQAPRIGREIRRDHTTVLHGLRRSKRKIIQGDQDFMEKCNRIQELLSERQIPFEAARDRLKEEIEAARERLKQEIENERRGKEKSIKQVFEPQRRGELLGGSEAGREAFGMSYRQLVQANEKLLGALRRYHPEMQGV